MKNFGDFINEKIENLKKEIEELLNKKYKGMYLADTRKDKKRFLGKIISVEYTQGVDFYSGDIVGRIIFNYENKQGNIRQRRADALEIPYENNSFNFPFIFSEDEVSLKLLVELGK